MTGHPTDESPIEAKLAAPPPGGIDAVDDDFKSSDDDGDELGTPVKQKSSRLQSRFAVLSILFLITGAIGIPLLWVSPQFSRGEQVFWTIVVSLYTLSLLAIAGSVVWWLYSRMQDLGML
ncbi:MAG: hypothetical protein WBD20_10735 [Pirellulaceae bacterium]